MCSKLHIIFLFLLIGSFQLFAQETKEDIEKKALSFFQNEQFIEATPLYLRLLSLEPRNPNYNYRYGTCLLFNSEEKQKAFKYLNFSIQKDNEVEDEAYYYLAKAYHLTYQFDKAIDNFLIYKEKAGNRALSNLNVDRQIEMCRNGKSLIANISETIVLKKTKIDKESFFRIYNLQDIGGELIVTAEFQNKQDKKNNHIPLIHFPSNSNRIYYSSYGDNSDNKDIYVRTRLPNGTWSLEQPIFGNVNTLYNEDFPYMHPTGKYLYFSSEGHNSMGGYDVFRSVYDAETNSFGQPENMDISISSPDNDFLYIVDSLDRYAYFASQRESEPDKVHVYNVRVERFPIQMIILKGKFNSTINPDEKVLSITVNNNSGELMGEFETTPKGDYLINLPKGGKYEFIVSVGNKGQQHRQTIDLPYLKEFRPLKQAITETEKDQAEIILFKNLFNERFENEGAIIAEAIQLKSKMEVNKDQFDIDSLDNLREQRKVFDEIGLSTFTNQEIHDLIKSKYADLQLRQNKTEELIIKSQATLMNGNDKIEEALNTADSLMQLAKMTDNAKRAERFSQLVQKEIQKAAQVQSEMDNAKVILSFLEEDFKKNELHLNEAKSINSGVTDMKISDDKSLIELLSQHQKFVSKELLKDTKINAHFEYLAQIEEKLKAQEDLKARERKLLEDQKSLASKIEELKKSYEAASKRKREDVGLELSRAENQLSDLNNELKYIDDQLKESKVLAMQKDIFAEIIDQKIPKNNLNNSQIAQKNDELIAQQKTISKDNKEFATNNNVDLSEKAISNVSEELALNSNETNTESTNQTSNDRKSTTNDTTSNQDNAISEEVRVVTTEEILAEFDPQYLNEIKQLEEDVATGSTSKQALVERKYKAVSSIGEAKTKAIQSKENSSDSKLLTQKIEVLTQLENQLKNEIQSLEQVIEEENNLAEENSTNTEVKNETTNFNERSNNSKNNNEESTTTDSTENINNSENLSNTENSTIEENQAEENIKSSTPEMIFAEVDPQYLKEIQQLESEINNGTKTKQDLVKRKYTALISVGDVKTETINQQKNNTESKDLKQKIQILAQLENQITDEIKDLEAEIAKENQLDEKESIALEQKVLEETDKGFQKQINSLLVNFHSGQNIYEELIYAQEVHLSKIDKALAGSEDLSIHDINILNQEKEKTTAFIAELKTAQSNEKANINTTYNDVIQESLLTQNELDVLGEDPKTKEEAENKVKVLDKIILKIDDKLASTNNDFEIRNLNQVKKEIEQKRRSVSFDFGDVTQITENSKKVDIEKIQEDLSVLLTDNQVKEFQNLYEDKNELLAAEKEDSTLVNNKRHIKKTLKVENAIASAENEVLEKSINSRNDSLTENIKQFKNDDNPTQSILQAQQNEIEVEQLIQEAEKQKDPKKQRELLKTAQEKQNEALRKIEEEEKQQKIETVVKEVIASNSYENINPENTLKTEEDLKKEQNDIGVQLLSIKDQINGINAILPSAKKKEKENLEQNNEKLIKIQKKLVEKQEQNEVKLAQIEQQKIEDANKGIAENAIENNLTYVEEVEIAQSEAYKELLKSNNKLNQLQFELKTKEEQLITEQNELKQITSSSDAKVEFSEDERKVIAQQLEKIDQTTGEIKVLRQEIQTQQQTLQLKLAEENQQKEKVENMIARDVAPIKEAPTLPTIATGLILSDIKKNNYSDENPIPLEIESPKGLVFRVQIGAFSKPVPNNTFTEFSPITGDVVRPGLIRYVAGFFNNRDTATEARNKIRSMGYSDAFVVAYCDGERIPVYRAIELMNSGACVPTIENSENTIVNASETSENSGTSFTKELDEFAYNKAPGAAEADVAESKMGLYYTVQVGVYNKPVSAAQLFNITPLITKRLPNGQIRYSSGMFNSIVEAKPKQLDAINKGVKDAFITAYYQGERISVGQAQELLSVKGEGILELNNPTISKRNKIINKPSTPIIKEKEELFLENRSTQFILISTIQFDSYPTQIINRYNEEGDLFYYDSLTQKINSFVYNKTEQLPVFNEDFDVIELYNYTYPVNNKNGTKRSEALIDSDKNTMTLNVRITAQDLNSDILETILNAPFNKQMKTENNSLMVKFYLLDTPENDKIINQLQVLLAKLGATHISKFKQTLESN